MTKCKILYSVVDDYYILYTLIHHNFDIELVSSDQFRDHLSHLDAQNTADFQRWQRAHQYVTKAFTADGSPVFKVTDSTYIIPTAIGAFMTS